ncbi:MAG: NAD(P)-dependent oxidoreductase [Pseudomonadota bacterium]
MAGIAFLGLGVMGGPMAGHLAKAGHSVSVWNRTPAKSEAWAERHRGTVETDPARAAFAKEFVVFCLGDDPDVRAVFDAVYPSIGGGMVVIDHTTASSALARDLYQACQSRGAAFLDAPISGGEAGAISGQLSVMCGGDSPAYDKAKPVMDTYAKQTTLIGPSGAGQLCKSVNQICIAGLLQGLSEGIAFAKSAGLETSKVFEAISGGAAQSWQMDNRATTMANGEFEFGFAVDWMRKDLRIALEAARENGVSLPVTAQVDQYYADVQAMGGGRFDTSSLVKRLTRDES